MEFLNTKRLAKQGTLEEHSQNQKPVLYVDTREQNPAITEKLSELGCEARVKTLPVGDYVLSDSVAVERKTVEDFLQSIIDGRLFEQLESMRANYEKPLLLIEGELQKIYSLRNIHKNSVIGALTAAALNYRVPILFTSCPRETVEFLYNIAKREQMGKPSNIRLRVGKKGSTLAEQQLFVVESLPFVGPKMAKALLREFKTIRNIANALSKDLQRVENLGGKKARYIKKLFRAEYTET